MRHASFGILFTFLLSGCGPSLVWGGDEATKDRLLKIVPIGSTVRDLETKAAARDWRISSRDDRQFPKGEAHYFGDGCQFQGGASRYVIVAEYGLLPTTVETVWLFDEQAKQS